MLKMTANLFIGLLVMLLCMLTLAADKAVSAVDVEKLNEQIRVLDKDLAVLKEVSTKQLDAQDKRIADLSLSASHQSNHIAMVANQTASLGNFIGIVSLLIAVIAAVAGIFVYRRIPQKAADEANKWFRDNSKQLMGNLKNQATQAEQSMKAHTDAVVKTRLLTETAIKQAGSDILSVKDPLNGDQNATTTNSESLKIVAEASKALEAKPEVNFSAKEHFLRGLAHFGAKNFQSAIISFDNAIANNPDNEEFAKVLFGKGLSLGKLDKFEEAIAVYEQIDQRYGKDDTPAMRDLVAIALFNKGVRLGALSKSEEAINVYDQIDQRYGKDDSPAIRKQVVKALVNKGFRLGAMGKHEDAIAVYEQIDQRFGKDDAPAMREQVARALNGGAFHQIMLSKQQWTSLANRTSYLREALIKLERSLKLLKAEDTAMVQGNFGYAHFLLGNNELAEAHTLTCLKLGGEELLTGQRADAKMYRLEPEDTEYEALLEACWQKLHPNT